MSEKKMKKIDFVIIIKKVCENRKLFYITLPIVFVVSCLLILCVPRTYSTDTQVVPEIDNSKGSGALSSLASSFGFDLSSMQTTDAITPLLYPDLMEDNKFVSELFNIKVTSVDGKINTTYYNYLAKYNQLPWWSLLVAKIKMALSSNEKFNKKSEFDPYHVNRFNNYIMNLIRKNVDISVDKKTAVISISVEAQDPLICKTVADSVKERLQTFITNYRTNKARIDEKHYKNLVDEAKADYEKARRLYGSYADSNMEMVLESYRAKQTDLENDMQLKYNTYTTLMTQYQMAKAKVQERTPAFTLVQGAAVPIKPAGPKRMLFVAGMCLLAIILLSLYSIKDVILKE